MIEGSSALSRLLEALHLARGTDFSFYKPASLQRRIDKRMAEVGLTDADDYVDYLDVHPEEFQELFNTILINVTSFFRDPETWAYIANECIPRVVESTRGRDLRVWVPGCATGEEAYTIAMLLAEALGHLEFKQRVKIFATDIDEDALGVARHARYSKKALESIPDDLRARYFSEAPNGTSGFKSDLRHNLIFGRHDLTRDAPIRNVDLLSCRNTLMYLNAEAQALVATRLHFAMRGDGVLILGRAEGMFAHGDLFQPISLKHRVFAKVPDVDVRQRLLSLAEDTSSERLSEEVLLAEVAFDENPVPQILLNMKGRVCAINSRARAMFGLAAQDVGRAFHDLEISYRPVEVRSLIDAAHAQGSPTRAKTAERHLPDGSVQSLDIEVVPLNGTASVGTCIVFNDVTGHRRVEDDLQRSRHALETAYEELQSSNEELETTNEELQSTVEELETTNEELQSTNEELETLNEELQSTNEELQTLNDELGVRTEEIDEVNAFLESIVSGLDSGLIAIDAAGTVTKWNRRSQDLWGLRADEVEGSSIFALDIGLPLDVLRAPIETITEAGSDPRRDRSHPQIHVPARNRRGQPISLRIAFSPLLGREGAVRGVIMLLTEER